MDTTATTQAHTPGPWTFNDGLCIYAQKNGREMCVCEMSTSDSRLFDNPELEANARLIAAAPDLLEACKAALQFVRESVHSFDGAIRPQEESLLLSAIAKASPSTL